MSQKTLKVRRVFALSMYNNLRNVPPKDYPSTGEIKNTLSVLPVLKELAAGYLDVFKRASELSEKLSAKSVSDEEHKVAVEKLNEELKAYNGEHSNDVVDVVLDEDCMKTLKTQFERDGWGKKWVVTVEEFGELLEAFNEAVK